MTKEVEVEVIKVPKTMSWEDEEYKYSMNTQWYEGVQSMYITLTQPNGEINQYFGVDMRGYQDLCGNIKDRHTTAKSVDIEYILINGQWSEAQ